MILYLQWLIDQLHTHIMHACFDAYWSMVALHADHKHLCYINNMHECVHDNILKGTI